MAAALATEICQISEARREERQNKFQIKIKINSSSKNQFRGVETDKEKLGTEKSKKIASLKLS